MNLYLFTSNDSVSNYDLLGNVTVTQVAKVGHQLGFAEDPVVKAAAVSNFYNLNEQKLLNITPTCFTDLIKKIQTKLGAKNANGNFGKDTVAAYEKWATSNNATKVKFIDARNPKEILKWIIKYWPNEHKCAKSCPAHYGEVLAIIRFESADYYVAPQPVYLNALAGDAGMSKRTAVGLGQISWETAYDAGITPEERYDAEKNVKGVVNIIFSGAKMKNGKCTFPGIPRFSVTKASIHKADIDRMGEAINKELANVEGDPERISESKLKSILGIP